MAAITDAVETFQGEITHVSEGSSVVFTLTVTDDASGFDIDDDVTIVSSDTAASAIDKPMDAEVTEDPAGTFTFSLMFPTVTKARTYTITVVASGVTGLSADKTVKIVVLKDIEINHTFGQILNFPVRITGSNVSEVDVQGLLRPLYHHWDATSGIVYIRHIGVVEELYSDLEFTISARDENGLIDVGCVLNVMQPAPAIRLPTEPLQFYFGRENKVDLQIDNKPSKVEVFGTLFGLTTKRQDPGVRFEGTLPEYGDSKAQMIPGVSGGEFLVIASNSGNDPVSAFVPWVAVGNAQFLEGSFAQQAALNTAFSETIEIESETAVTVTVETGALPTGLTLSTARSGTRTTVSFAGMPTATGTFTFKLKATSTEGVTVSSEYTVVVYTALIAPSQKRALPSSWNRRISRHFPLDMNPYFNRGTPLGTYTLVQRRTGTRPPEEAFAISADGMLTVLPGIMVSGSLFRYVLEITVTNTEGNFSQSFTCALRN